jgi:hypothetical protein
MDKTTASVIGLVILAVVGVVFAVRYRGKGKLTVKSAFGSLKAEGENPPLARPSPEGRPPFNHRTVLGFQLAQKG